MKSKQFFAKVVVVSKIRMRLSVTIEELVASIVIICVRNQLVGSSTTRLTSD